MDASILRRLVDIRDQVSDVIEQVQKKDPVTCEEVKARSKHRMPMGVSRYSPTTMLVTNPLLVEWLRDAGLSSYEINLLTEETLAGTTVRDRLMSGLKIGIQIAVFRMRHDPTENGELISAWAEDRQVETSVDWDSISNGAVTLLAMQDERATLLEAEAQQDKQRALHPDLHPDDVASIQRKAAFLEGKAQGIRHTSMLVVEAAVRAEKASPKKGL